MWSGFPYNMAASEHSDAYMVSWGSKSDYQKRSRGKLSCLLWPSFGTHMLQLPLWSEAFPDGRCVKVTLYEEHMGGVYYYSYLPKIPPWLYLSKRGYFPHPIAWALTLFSQAFSSLLCHHRGSPITKEIELKLPPRSARKDNTGVLFGLFPFNISSVSENLLILKSRGPKNS